MICKKSHVEDGKGEENFWLLKGEYLNPEMSNCNSPHERNPDYRTSHGLEDGNVEARGKSPGFVPYLPRNSGSCATNPVDRNLTLCRYSSIVVSNMSQGSVPAHEALLSGPQCCPWVWTDMTQPGPAGRAQTAFWMHLLLWWLQELHCTRHLPQVLPHDTHSTCSSQCRASAVRGAHRHYMQQRSWQTKAGDASGTVLNQLLAALNTVLLPEQPEQELWNLHYMRHLPWLDCATYGSHSSHTRIHIVYGAPSPAAPRNIGPEATGMGAGSRIGGDRRGERGKRKGGVQGPLPQSSSWSSSKSLNLAHKETDTRKLIQILLICLDL